MPKNFNSNDLSILTGIVKVEGGVYTVTRAIAGHKPGETMNEERAIELAKFLTPPMSELDRELVRVPSYSSSSTNDDDDDYYPDYEGEDLEDAED